jgi:hypothetical protein
MQASRETGCSLESLPVDPLKKRPRRRPVTGITPTVGSRLPPEIRKRALNRMDDGTSQSRPFRFVVDILPCALDCRLDGPMTTLSPVTQADDPGVQDCCSSAGVGRREHTWGSHANRGHSAEARGRRSFPNDKTLFGRWQQSRSQTRWPQR